MSTRTDQQNVEAAANHLGTNLLDAVADTLTERTPDPSRGRIAIALQAVRGVEPDEAARTIELMITLVLVRWLSVARVEMQDRPECVDEALGWVEESMGRRYRARAAYTSAVLRDEAGATEILQYREALGDDFLPSLVWLLAGVVATHADGDVEWLATLAGVSRSSWEAG